MTGPRDPAASEGRLFFGVALTDGARHAVQGHLAHERIPGRSTAPEGWHLTLRFLGETAPDALERLRERRAAADLGARFDVVFGRLGAFPAPESAEVLWLGVNEGAPALAALAARVESCAREAGFPAETRPYMPHVTLSRLRPPADVRRLVERVPALREGMAVDAIVLFRRRLGGEPGRYEELQRFPLSLQP